MWSAQGRLRDGPDLNLGPPLDWRRGDIALPVPPVVLVPDAALRLRWDRAVLDWLRQGDAAAAHSLRDLSLGLAVGQARLAPRVFWKICAAFFEVLGSLNATADPVLKRAVARILQQCAALVRGESAEPEALAQLLLNHCQAVAPADAAALPLWTVLRQAYVATPQAHSPDDWLNAADEDSQRLETALAGWSLTPQLPLPANAVPWAWALAVSAGDAGLAVLADFAGLLAQALQAATAWSRTPEQAQMLAASAEHLRQLLHQHAAGFEKAPQPALLQALRALAHTTA